jgi:hypothetical protein
MQNRKSLKCLCHLTPKRTSHSTPTNRPNLKKQRVQLQSKRWRAEGARAEGARAVNQTSLAKRTSCKRSRPRPSRFGIPRS